VGDEYDDQEDDEGYLSCETVDRNTLGECLTSPHGGETIVRLNQINGQSDEEEEDQEEQDEEQEGEDEMDEEEGGEEEIHGAGLAPGEVLTSGETWLQGVSQVREQSIKVFYESMSRAQCF